MKIEYEYPGIMDPEIEAKELENALRDMSKAIREANKKPGKSGLSYLEFKAKFLTTTVKPKNVNESKNFYAI